MMCGGSGSSGSSGSWGNGRVAGVEAGASRVAAATYSSGWCTMTHIRTSYLCGAGD